MSATNGLTRSFRLLGCLMAVALLASALFASAASAKKPEPTNPTLMVNLGDSVSYGYTAQKFAENFPSEPPSAFEGGYPNLVQAKLAKKEAKINNKLELANLACPGETSKGLIGNGPIAEGLEAAKAVTHFTGGEAPCGWHNASGLPRHVEFGSVSQLEAAVGLVKASVEKTGPEIKDITLQIGSNDELHKLGECSSPAYLSAHKFASFLECVQVEAENTLFPTIVNNIGLTIHVLRENGYTGPIGILGFYNPQALLLPSDPLQIALNDSDGRNDQRWRVRRTRCLRQPVQEDQPAGQEIADTRKKRIIAERNAICLYTEECNAFDRKVEFEKATKTVGHGRRNGRDHRFQRRIQTRKRRRRSVPAR